MTAGTAALQEGVFAGSPVPEALVQVNAWMRGRQGTIERRDEGGAAGHRWKGGRLTLRPSLCNGLWEVGGAGARVDDITSVNVRRRDGGAVIEVAARFSIFVLDVDDPPQVA